MTTVLALSREEAATASRLSTDTIDRAIHAGELRAKKSGRRVLILPRDLEKFLDGLDDA